MKDDDQEITDEELQQLIDTNEADSGEPSGISPRRRQKLLRDTENRIREHPLFQQELAKAKEQDKPAKANGLPLTDEEKALAFAYTGGDPIIEYLIDRRGALLRGVSADGIDTLTEEWAEQYGIDLDVLDEEWVGTEPLKLKQIRRIKDETEQDAAIEALATENVLRRERQEAIQPTHKFTDEWYAEQQRRHPWRSLVVISRWAMVLPVSFLAGIGTFYCLMLLDQIFMFGWSEAGLFTRVFILLVNGGASGAAIVYVAFHLAPFRKSETIFVICALVVLSCGFCIALAIVDPFLPSIVTNTSAAAGACFVTWKVLSSTK